MSTHYIRVSSLVAKCVRVSLSHRCHLYTSSSISMIRKEQSRSPSSVPATIRKFLTSRNENIGPEHEIVYNSQMDYYAISITLTNYLILLVGAGCATNWITLFPSEEDSIMYMTPSHITVVVAVLGLYLAAMNAWAHVSPMRIYFEESSGLYEARFSHPLVLGHTKPFKFSPKSGKLYWEEGLSCLQVSNGQTSRSLFVLPSRFKAPMYYKDILSNSD